MRTSYRVKEVRMESGERFPLLLRLDTGMPVGVVCDYSLAYHRTLSINSSKQQVGAIGLLLEWADAREIDLDQRFGSGDLLSQAEVESLATCLRMSKRSTVSIGGETVPGVVIGDTHGNRMDWVRNFISWRARNMCQAIPVNDPRVSAVADRLAAIERQLGSLKTAGGSRKRLGLTEKQQIRLFEIVKPGAPENPFRAET